MAGLPKSEAMIVFLFVSIAFLFTASFSTAVGVKTADRVSATYSFLQNPFVVGYLPTQKSFCLQNSNTLSSKTLKGLADSLRILTTFSKVLNLWKG